MQFQEKNEIFSKISLQTETKEPEATNAMLWICGDYGENIDDAPYIIELFTDDFDNQTTLNKLQVTNIFQLLTSAVKLFLKRPPEMQKILGKLFKLIIENEKEAVDLKDRASFYYKSLYLTP